ncbi:hypothetical protein N9003_00835 [bacterium]|nr:hypothetical protein [bacterium]
MTFISSVVGESRLKVNRELGFRSVAVAGHLHPDWGSIANVDPLSATGKRLRSPTMK